MVNKLTTLSFFIGRGIHTFVSYWSGYKITPKPGVAYLELTYRCTCRCHFCERWKIGPKMAEEELTTEEIKHLLVDAYKIGVRYMGFTGGEAFLRKDIFEIGKFAKKLGLTLTIASNGTLITEKNVGEIAKYFSSVTISMDGIVSGTHDSLRGVKGVYDKAMNALDLLQKVKVPVAVNMVITRDNFMEIDKYIQFFSKKNISLQFTPVHENEKSYLRVQKGLKEIDMNTFVKEWQRLSEKYPFLNNGYYKHVPTFFSAPSKLLRAYTCFAGAVMFSMNPYGDVFPCEFNRTSMGNVRKEKLPVIWKKAQKLRQEISSAKRTCICWSQCAVPLNNRLTRAIACKKLFSR